LKVPGCLEEKDTIFYIFWSPTGHYTYRPELFLCMFRRLEYPPYSKVSIQAWYSWSRPNLQISIYRLAQLSLVTGMQWRFLGSKVRICGSCLAIHVDGDSHLGVFSMPRQQSWFDGHTCMGLIGYSFIVNSENEWQ